MRRLKQGPDSDFIPGDITVINRNSEKSIECDTCDGGELQHDQTENYYLLYKYQVSHEPQTESDVVLNIKECKRETHISTKITSN